MTAFFPRYYLLKNKQSHHVGCVCGCVCVRAHLVDTRDCLFDRGWVCKWEPWQDNLLDSLQGITVEREKILGNRSLTNREDHKYTQEIHPDTHTLAHR